MKKPKPVYVPFEEEKATAMVTEAMKSFQV